MQKTTAAAGALLWIGLQPAGAGCREDIQAMLEAGEAATNYRIASETIMGGAVVQHVEQEFRDYSHFRQHVRETGVRLLVLGAQEYMSKDGESWTPWQTREANWLEETRARNAALRDGITDVACGTEVIDGTSYTVFRHTQETTQPVVSVSEVVTHVDAATGRPALRHMKTVVGGQQIETRATFAWDQEVELPVP